MKSYREEELKNAFHKFKTEMDALNLRKIEIFRCELDIYKELVTVVYADEPEKLSEYFRKI